jgi:hypothetical protein
VRPLPIRNLVLAVVAGGAAAGAGLAAERVVPWPVATVAAAGAFAAVAALALVVGGRDRSEMAAERRS